MAGGVSYKWHGSKIAVLTGFGSTKTITTITKANPAVVTSTAHGLANGDIVKIAGVVGMVEVNNRVFVVSGITANTFNLTDVDSTGYGTYVSGGTAAPAVMSNYCQLTGYNRAGGASPEQDVSTICSTAAEFELGLPDYGTTTLDYLFSLNDTVNKALQAADVSKDTIGVAVTLPKSGGLMVQLGIVQSTSESAANGGFWTGSASIRNVGRRVDITTP